MESHILRATRAPRHATVSAWGPAGGRRLKSVERQPSSTIGEDRDRRVAAFAVKRRGLILYFELRAIGFSKGAIDHRVRTGRLYRIHSGVFAVHPPPYSWRQRVLAAVLACGHGATASHLCASTLLSLTEITLRVIDISGAGQRGRNRTGINSHRTPLLPCDRTAVDGIPCTAAARTLVDIAPLLEDDALEDALIAADSLRILNRRRLDELIGERAGRPGITRLARLVADDPARASPDRRVRLLALAWGAQPRRDRPRPRSDPEDRGLGHGPLHP